MPIRVLVPQESSPKEARVALIPETVGRLVKMGFEVGVERGAGEASYYSDELYEKAGARLESSGPSLFQKAEILLKVQPPLEGEIAEFPEGITVIGFFYPHRHPERIPLLQKKKVNYFAMELIPRISRAQAMDALSSQATVNGYRSALLGADLSPRFFPMLTTAAGTIRPAKVLVLGAGVAGLQAIATARRLGAVVEAYDVRASSKEEVESLGAKFITSGVEAEAKGGYARELSPDERKKEQEKVAEHICGADVVITTAHVPGRPAPKLVTEEMVARMRPGSVIIDVSAESGGNCSLTLLGEVVEKNGVKIFGPENLPSSLPTHASEMYSKNLYHFLSHLTQNGKTLEFDLKDEIVSDSLALHQGEIRHGPTRALVSSYSPSPPLRGEGDL